MITMAIVCCIVGFYLFYHTSKRIRVKRSLSIEQWAYKNKFSSQLIGSFFFIVSFILSVIELGWAAGSLFFAVTLMTVASLTILTIPLRVFRWKWIGASFLVLFILELIV